DRVGEFKAARADQRRVLAKAVTGHVGGSCSAPASPGATGCDTCCKHRGLRVDRFVQAFGGSLLHELPEVKTEERGCLRERRRNVRVLCGQCGKHTDRWRSLAWKDHGKCHGGAPRKKVIISARAASDGV